MVTWQAAVPSSTAGPWPFWNLPESARLCHDQMPRVRARVGGGLQAPQEEQRGQAGRGSDWRPSPAAREAWLSRAGSLRLLGLCGLSFQDVCLATTSLTLRQVARARGGSPGVRRAPVTDAHRHVYLRDAWTARPDSVTRDCQLTRAPRPRVPAPRVLAEGWGADPGSGAAESSVPRDGRAGGATGQDLLAAPPEGSCVEPGHRAAWQGRGGGGAPGLET